MMERLMALLPFAVIAIFFLLGLWGSKINDALNERERAAQQISK
jgi:hypothetical protein